VAEPVFVDTSNLPTENRSVDGRTVVDWWTLFGGGPGATTGETSGIVMGIAEIPVDAHRPARGHSHPHSEVYVILAGSAEVHVDGHPARTIGVGEAVWIPAGVEHVALNASATEPLRLLYAFGGVDRFADIEYTFPPGA
jgi:mannose-6-phosphate isomerase-like protein (cupin superfamily)